MNARPSRRYRRLAIAIVVASVVISASVLSYSSFEATVTKTATTGANTCGPFGCDEGTTTSSASASTSRSSTSTSAGTCVTEPGQPRGAYLSVVHDTNSTPVLGVGVTAYPMPTNGCTSAPLKFTANGTESYSLPVTNIDGYQITVSYLRHDFNLSLSLGLSTWNCETLYLPSGNTSVITSTESSCALLVPPSPATLTRSNFTWKFEVQLNSTELSVGQLISYSCSLVNTSNQTQTVVVGSPLCTPSIYTQQGQLLWAYTSSATNSLQEVSPGQSFNFATSIPSSQLLPGGRYVLNSYPDLLSNSNPEVPIGQSLQVNATIEVAS